MLKILALAVMQPAVPQQADLSIVDLATCDEQCDQYIPDGFLGDFARTKSLCSNRRFYVSRNAVGFDDRFTFIEESRIRRIDKAGAAWSTATEIRISGYEQTAHTEGAATADPVDVTMTLLYDEETDRLTITRSNAATETYVRCPKAPKVSL